MKKIIFLILFFPSALFADFVESGRSINYTAETLKENYWDISATGVSYGVNDSWMVGTTPWTPYFKAYHFYSRKNFRLDKDFLIAPEVEVAFDQRRALGYGFGLAHGLTLGGRDQHVLTLTARFRRIYYGETEETQRNVFNVNANYDYYFENGDLFYFGKFGHSPFVGYTFAYKYVHFGMIVIAGSAWSLVAETGMNEYRDFDEKMILPIPYIYFRF